MPPPTSSTSTTPAAAADRRARRGSGLLRRRLRPGPRRRRGVRQCCSEDEVIALHLAREYRVFVVGFVPGFAYMASVDPRIAAPRRSSPRPAVPAGSVAIAAGQTGIYPAETPGGWSLIGRTPVAAVRSRRGASRSSFMPGDRVRFRRIAEPVDGDTDVARLRGAVTVIKPGMLTTVQDLGRWGYQGLGVPVPGRWTAYSHRLANQLARQRRRRPRRSRSRCSVRSSWPTATSTCAVAGADIRADRGDAVAPMNEPFVVPSGARLRFGARGAGARG